MGWFKNLVSDGASQVVDSISSGLDNLFTSDEERLQAKALIQKQLQNYSIQVLEALGRYDAEVTERWKSDNEHLITRLVRPLSFIAVLGAFFVISFADGNIGEFTINKAYIPVYEGLLYTMVIAYFGSRGIEKTTKLIKKPKPKIWGE